MAEKKIRDRTFSVGSLPAGEALELYAELIAALGSAAHRLPAIILAASEETDGPNVMADIATFIAIADVVRNATPAGARDLIKRIIEIAEIRRDGSTAYHSIEFDIDFRGEHLKDIVPVAKFVLEAQFGDFFPEGGLSGLLGRLRAALANTKSAGSPPT